MSLLVALSLIVGSWLGVLLAQRYGDSIWLRFVVLVALIGGFVFLWLAFSAYAGNCSGAAYGVEPSDPGWQILRVMYLVAWPSAFLIALSISATTQRLFRPNWLAPFAGLAGALLILAVPYLVLEPPLFVPCIPTPLVD